MAINQALIQKGESSVIKIVKFKGETTIINGHSHTFKVYTDDSVEIFDYYTKDDEGRDIKHKHIYVGDYPNGYILKDHQNHVHSITSVAHPIMFQNEFFPAIFCIPLRGVSCAFLPRLISAVSRGTPIMAVRIK